MFECNGSKDYHLITEVYKDSTKRVGPQDKMKSIEETAKAVRHCMKDRSQIKEVIEKYG